MAKVRRYRGSWVLDYRDASGRRIIRRQETKKAAEEALSEVIQARKAPTYDPTRGEEPLEAYAHRWLEMKRSEVKPATLVSYEYALRRHILPALGRFPIGKITREGVRLFVSDRLRSGLKPETVRILHSTLRALLEDAVDSGAAVANVARTKKGSRSLKLGESRAVRRERMKLLIFSRPDLALTLETAAEHRPEFHPVFLTLARTGLRIGEAIALKTGDVDFVNRHIEIHRNIVKGKVGTPKSGIGRKVDMSLQLTETLRRLVAKRKAEILEAGLSVDVLSDLWLFPNRDGKPVDDSKVRKVFNWILAKAGLPVRNLHVLRHTFASLLIEQGESLVYIKEQLGHSSISVTVDLYGHLVPGGNTRAVDGLDSLESGNSRLDSSESGNKVETRSSIGKKGEA